MLIMQATWQDFACVFFAWPRQHSSTTVYRKKNAGTGLPPIGLQPNRDKLLWMGEQTGLAQVEFRPN
jgi:hypothetical protein